MHLRTRVSFGTPKTAHHNQNDVLELIEHLPNPCAGEPRGAY